MWKKSLAILCLISHFSWAEGNMPQPKHWTQTELQQQLTAQKQQLQQALTLREKQRVLFTQADNLLNIAKEQRKLPQPSQQLIERIITQLNDYPLQQALRIHLQKVRIELNLANQAEIEHFIQHNPTSAQAKQWQQDHFERLYNEQKFTELLAYGQKIAPDSLDNQCRLFAAKFQLLAEQIKPNPEAEQAGNQQKSSLADLTTLLDEFSQFWANGTAPSAFWLKSNTHYFAENELSSACKAVEAYWRDQGLKTAQLVKLRALHLFEKNAKSGLENLRDNQLTPWLNALSALLNHPQNLQKFADTQPLTEENKAIMLQAFPRFVHTLNENQANPNFSLYQQWAKKFQLSANELNDWKISFISRLFDNNDESFKQWRDTQLLTLQNDYLTERRLRMAIWQQTTLLPWLKALSENGKKKQEWRYWLAKSDPIQREKILNELSNERGFYPMLAAHQLGKHYHYRQPHFTEIAVDGEPQLQEIAEFRALGKNNNARAKWIDWLKTIPFNKQVALAQYANEQGWYDLGVEATIQAKAWDYIEQRLPKAYADWFELNVADTPISKSFAMAIARQESAWNSQVKSSANAVGLMQILPNTARMTAQAMGLLYRGENDLLDPFKNIMLGTAHLNQLNQKYPHNRILIAAAYNAGAGRADKWLMRADGKLAIDEFIASIPFLETRGYVQNVLVYDYYYQLINGEKSPYIFTQEELRKY